MYVYKDAFRPLFERSFMPFKVRIDGRDCLDLQSGAGAFFFGYSEFDNNINTTNLFSTEEEGLFISKIENVTNYKCPILLCSGSEANEAAIKLALLRNKGRKKIGFIPGCYFGRTYFASMCSDRQSQKDYLPGLEFFKAVTKSEDLDEDVSCLIIETFPSVSLNWNLFILLLVEKAKELGIIVIVDETKGAFRTGQLFSFGNDFRPDIVTMSKSLASGFPMSAVLVKENLLSECDDRWYSTTTGGHKAGCTLAYDNLKRINELDSSLLFEKKYASRLVSIFGDRAHIIGRYISIGKMNGIAFSRWCLDKNFFIYTRSNFVSFFPQLKMDIEFGLFLDMLESKQDELSGFFK